jgi:hypothetical protein
LKAGENELNSGQPKAQPKFLVRSKKLRTLQTEGSGESAILLK